MKETLPQKLESDLINLFAEAMILTDFVKQIMVSFVQVIFFARPVICFTDFIVKISDLVSLLIYYIFTSLASSLCLDNSEVVDVDNFGVSTLFEVFAFNF